MIRIFYLLALIFIIKMAGATKIDTTQIVVIGGIEQYLRINGNDLNKPLLLYLHGGPGAAVSAHKDFVTQKLEDHFVVVHWDQRGSGKTQDLTGVVKPPTLSEIQQDTEEVMNYLLAYFNKEKLVVLGNSWGTVLGFHLAKNYTEKISAFIAVSPVVSNLRSQQATLQIFKDHFQQEGNTKAVQQLSEVKIPYEEVEQMLVQYRWETVFGGEEMSDEQFEQLLSYFRNWEKIWMPLYRELYSIDLEKSVSTLDCPVFFIVGDEDYTTYFKFTEEYFNQLKAPSKKLFLIENVGHNIPASAAERMQDIIIENISSEIEW